MRKASLGTLFLTVFLDLLGFGLVIPFLPGLARQFGASDFVAALTGAVYSLMQFVFVPVWGGLSDRVGRRPVLLGSIAATAVGMTALGFSRSLVALFAARIFSGMATANIAVAQAYIADTTTPAERARGMGLIGMAFGLGFILGPFFGGELARVPVMGQLGTMPALVAAGLSLINLALAARTLPESLPPEARGKRRRLAPLDFAVTRRVMAAPEITRALLINFLLVFCFAGMEQTFRLFTEDGFQMTAAATGRVLGLVGLVSAIVQGGLIGRLNRRFGEVRLLRVGLVIQAAAFALLGLSPRAVFAPRLVLTVSAGLIALGSALVTPSVSSFVSRRSAIDVQGMALGTLQSFSALARVLGPAVGGLLYESISPPTPYFAGAGGMLLAALLAAGLHRRSPATADAPSGTPAGTP